MQGFPSRSMTNPYVPAKQYLGSVYFSLAGRDMHLMWQSERMGNETNDFCSRQSAFVTLASAIRSASSFERLPNFLAARKSSGIITRRLMAEKIRFSGFCHVLVDFRGFIRSTVGLS
jgi:hypothetical protein